MSSAHRHAWIDESVRAQGSGIPTYFVGACICDIPEENIRRKLDPIKPAKAKKLHWRDMTPTQQRKSIPVVQSLGLQYIIVAAAPLDNAVKSERARRKCLEVLLPMLETTYLVDRATFESRDEAQDKRDYNLAQGLKSRRFIRKLQVDFKPGHADARLWVADQALGAIGDQDNGITGYQTFTSQVNRIDIDSHQ